MANLVPSGEDLKNVTRYKSAFAIILFAGLVWYFVHKFTDSSGDRVTDCKERIEQMQNNDRIKDSIFNKQLQAERDYSSALRLQLDGKEEALERVDSLLRAKLEEKK